MDFFAKIKLWIRQILPQACLEWLTYGPFDQQFFHKSYSQDGEDILLRTLFTSVSQGFYVDIGAHHPKRFSNTFYFYRRGWRGINVDPLPGSMELFNRVRSNDINLNIGISPEKTELTYYLFDEPAVNTFNAEIAKELIENEIHHCKLIETRQVSVDRLEHVLDQYLTSVIHFMSIDVEGYELEVLQSNNWEKYRPQVILIETHHLNLENIHTHTVHQYLHAVGYHLFAKTLMTAFYRDQDF